MACPSSPSLPSKLIYSPNEVATHNSPNDLWAIIENYVVDLTDFLTHHPGSTQKILSKRKQLGVDISPNFVDHFGHTVSTYRDACRRFEDGRCQEIVEFTFRERGGNVVKIVGKVG
mmetsp:Transcript_31629/g.47167  ORF Transcript_31629/g.47167 Transcript_31629/m.47167 type:complete len:116 (-) Transcript_31629:269-616(-)